MEGIIGALRSDRFYKFLHLPIEAGSDAILKSMKRQYTIDSYRDLIKELRGKIQNLSIETDIIVGFPGETESEFDESVALVEELRFGVTNVSRFGTRPHAPASRMRQLSSSVINERSNRISRTVRSVQRSINERFIGREVDTLFTEETPSSLNGRTDWYRQVVLRENDGSARMGERCALRIEDVSANVLYGTMVG